MTPLTTIFWAVLSWGFVSGPETATETGRARTLIDAAAASARRRRIVGGLLDLSLGGGQVAVGTAALVHLRDRGPGVYRHAIKEVVAGGAAVLVGCVFLGVRSQMELLRDDEEFVRLARGPARAESLRALERQWQHRADNARRLRRVSGGLTLAAGAGLATWGVVSLALGQPLRTDGGAVWGVATTTGGAFLMTQGGLDLALPSPAEESWKAYLGGRDSRGERRTAVLVRWSVSGVSGRF